MGAHSVAAPAMALSGRVRAMEPRRSSGKSSAFATGGKCAAKARATFARGRNTVTRAVVTPPTTHDNARPDATLRPVSAAAVDSSKALEQFRSMGGASRKFHFLTAPNTTR